MSLLQLEDTNVGQTINATLGSLSIVDVNTPQPTAMFTQRIIDPTRGPIATTEYMVGSNGAGFGGPWQDCKYIYNDNGGGPDGSVCKVWSIVNDISGGNVGDVRFSHNVAIDKNFTVAGTMNCTGCIDAPQNIVPLVVANPAQVFALGGADFNQIKPYQAPSSGATIALPATAGLVPGTYVTVLNSPASSGALSVSGAFSSAESVAPGQCCTYTVVQGNNSANLAVWFRTQKSA